MYMMTKQLCSKLVIQTCSLGLSQNIYSFYVSYGEDPGNLTQLTFTNKLLIFPNYTCVIHTYSSLAIWLLQLCYCNINALIYIILGMHVAKLTAS